MSSVFGLHSGPGKGVISHVSTYLANSNEPRIMLTEDSELFDVRLDGSDLRSLGSGCESDPFVIPATSWVACEGGGAMMLIDHQDPTERQRLTGAEGIYPSWMSDGSRVALVEAGCIVALYNVSPVSPTQLNLIPYARLVFPEDLCHIYSIALAPNGAWLALALAIDGVRTVEVLSLAQLPSFPPDSSSIPVVTVTAAMLQHAGSTDGRVTPVWMKKGNDWTLTFDDREIDAVVQTNLATHVASTVLNVPDGFPSAVAWTPSGDQLVFAISKSNGCLDCPTSYSPSRLYVYTPAT